MSSVITTRMFGRPSLSADRSGVGAAPTRRPRQRDQGDGRRRADAAASRASHAVLPACTDLPQRNTLCHTVSTMPMPDDHRSKDRTRADRERSRQRIIDATTELVRERSYAELNVGEIMERAGIGRTIFYRHFDDLGDLLMRAGREAIEELLTRRSSRSPRPASAGPDASARRSSSAVERLPPPRPAAARGRRGGGRPTGDRRRARRDPRGASTSWSRTRFDAGRERSDPGPRSRRPHGR